MRRAGSVNFGRWILLILFSNAVGCAIFIALAGMVLNLTIHQLWQPYLALVECGFVLAPLLYWARLSRERPKSCSIRFAISMFFYIQSVMLALGFSIIRLGIWSMKEVIYDYAPFMELLSVVVSFLIYLVVRQMLKAPESSSA